MKGESSSRHSFHRAQICKLETERAIIFPLTISLQTKAITCQFRVPGTGKYDPSSGYQPIVAQPSVQLFFLVHFTATHFNPFQPISLQAVSATLSLWKWSGAIFWFYKLDTERALLLPVSFSLRTKSIRRVFTVLETGNYPPSFGKLSLSFLKLG